MDINQYNDLLKSKQKEIEDLIRRKMPVFAGNIAKAHFQDNFRKGRFVNSSLSKWKPAKRLSSTSKGANSKYGTLLSGRDLLFNSIRYVPVVNCFQNCIFGILQTPNIAK